MKNQRVYKNLESVLKVTNISRKELTYVLPITQNTLTRRLNNTSELTLKECKIIKNYIKEKSGINFNLEYLFEV